MLLNKIKKAFRPLLAILGAALMIAGGAQVASASPNIQLVVQVDGTGSTATVHGYTTDTASAHQVAITINGVPTSSISVPVSASATTPTFFTKDFVVPYGQTLVIQPANGLYITSGLANGTTVTAGSYTNTTPPVSGPIQAPRPAPATVSADGHNYTIYGADHWTAAVDHTVLAPGTYPGSGTVVITYTVQRGYADDGQQTFTDTLQLKAAPPVNDGNEQHMLMCHATGSDTNPYEPKTISRAGVYNGHLDHKGDIWDAFPYTDGDTTIMVPAQGDQSILANGCKVKETPSPEPSSTPTETATPIPSSTPSSGSTPTSSSTPSSVVSSTPAASTHSTPAQTPAAVVGQVNTPSVVGQASLKARTAVGPSGPNYLPAVLLVGAGLLLILAALPRRRRGQH